MDAIYYQSPKKSRRIFSVKRVTLGLLLLLFLTGAAYGGFFAYKLYAIGKKVSADAPHQPSFLQTIKSLATDNPINLKSADPDRINILLLGIGGKENPAPNLTDTIMVMSIDRKTNRVAMLSIPRDLYAKVPDMNYASKINTIYQLELNDQTKNQDEKMQPLLATVKDITALDIDYYVVLNFSGFRQAIDDIGGVNITSDRDLYDPRYPGPNYSYETFSLSKGFHHLDGATALQYARERHNDPQGDFGRALRQQQIMQAAKNKIFSAATLFNPLALDNLLDTLGANVVTNISPDEIGSFLELSKKLDTQNITNVVLDAWNKDSLLQIVHVPVADSSYSALVPRVGNYSETRELAQNVFDLDALKRKRAEIADENAGVALINQSGNSLITARIQKLLSENLDYKNVTVLNIPGKTTADVSTVYDLTNGTKPFTTNELVTKLPAAISYDSSIPYPTSQGSKQFDIVVVLGKDLISKYTMEEGTVQDLNNERDNQDISNSPNN